MAIYTGTTGTDILSGGPGPDELRGGAGDDHYFVSEASDEVVELAGQGIDRVYASVSYVLRAGSHVEHLATTSNAGTAAINLTGNELANSIVGNAGANVLNGGGGADTLNGLGGNDTYFVDHAADLVIEGAGGGTDRVYTSTSYALRSGVHVESLVTTNNAGTLAINLTGNELANSVVGNAGANVLNGGGGADTLNGLGGNDSYFVDHAADLVVEGAGGGTDRVYSSVNYALRAGVHVEHLSTTSNAGTGAINLTGNELANSIVGNAGANVLNGGGGADTLNGLGGNDSYFVDHAADLVIEGAGGGTDRVYASTNYALRTGVHVEHLSTTSNAGTATINLTGNELVNSIVGNAGANVLNGGGGADTLNGLGGNDTYFVDHAADLVIEGAGGGTDRVYASTSYALRAGVHVEHLSTTSNAGTSAINLTGNELVNSIVGNAGVNVLNGGGGADTLNGLGGDDSYFVDHAGDIVVEVAGGGVDRVFTSVSYALRAGADIENLSTSNNAGTGAINLTGNEAWNTLIGNNGANVLNGGGGNDKLYGLGGADTLTGGAGSDGFVFSAPLGAGNIDTITDFNPAWSGYGVGSDTIYLSGAPGDPFAALATGQLDRIHFTHGSQAQTPHQMLIYNPVTGALVYDADGSGAGVGIQFATLAPNLNIDYVDFRVTGAPNTAPVIGTAPIVPVTDGAPAGTIVYQATASDAEGDRVFWSISSSDGLSIDEWGTVRLTEPANFETVNEYGFVLRAEDSAGNIYTSKLVQVPVTDVAESTPVIMETTAPNDLLGDAQTIDLAVLEVQPNPNLPDDTLPSVTIAGSIADAADRDSYSIWLEAGQVIYLDVDNTSGNLDSYVSLFRSYSDDTPIAENDDPEEPDLGSRDHPEYGHVTDSYLRVRVTTSGTYWFAIESLQDPNNPTSGTYELNVSIGPPATEAQLLQEDIEALISGAEWDHTHITYGFPTSTTQYPADIEETDEAGEFAPLTATQQAAVAAQLAAIASVSGLTFGVAGDPGAADLRYAMSDDPETAHAYYPENKGPDDLGGTLWFNKTDYLAPTPGNYDWLTFLHETGHALGLKHGHEYPAISQGRDSLEYTVMTYRSYVGANVGPDGGFTNETWGYPTTLMMLDIAALQQMYGANYLTNAGNTVYRWSPTTGEMSLNGVGQGAPGGNRILMTVWDGGGTDTYDLSAYSTGLTIDLRPGEWTKTGQVQLADLGGGNYARGNIANALLFEGDTRSLIENAIGGSGADTIIANQAANRLTGGAGADIFRWDGVGGLNGLGVDVITDFVSGTDKIDFNRVDARTDTEEWSLFSFIGTDAFTGGSGTPDTNPWYGELRYQVAGNVLTLFGDTNGDLVADFQLQFLGVSSLTVDDFVPWF